MFMLADHQFQVEGDVLPRDTDAATMRALLATNPRFRAPVAGAVYGTLLNDRVTLESMGEALAQPPYNAPPKAPILYLRPRNTWSGHGSRIAVPDAEPGVAVGGSLGIVIGHPGVHVGVAEAMDIVAGYTTLGDLCIPHESVYRPAVPLRARDGFCVIGPALVAKRHLINPEAVRISITVNGQPTFVTTTAACIRGVAQLLADVTEFMTLLPGDIVTLGAPHGVPIAHAGDAVQVRIADWEPLAFSLHAEDAVAAQARS
ncbi:MAG: fumarylacetoacetate hydrolase family protein [Rhodanobacter sp.]